MGGKHSGTRKQLYLCIALLMVLSPTACTLPMDKAPARVTAAEASRARADRHLLLGRQLLSRGDYPGALRENEKALTLTGKAPPAAEPLFAIGLIHAHPENPARDYKKSLASLKKLIMDYPASPLVEQARTLTSLIQDNDKLNSMIDRLHTMIDELKKVDIDIDRKKREQTK